MECLVGLLTVLAAGQLGDAKDWDDDDCVFRTRANGLEEFKK
jgi:hypothetical protein